MKFSEITNRLTGISFPIFGISWNPPVLERTIARKVIAHLEMKRVLYSDYEFEVIGYCVESILELKAFLMEVREEMIENTIKEDSNLYKYITSMLKACNRFLDRCNSDQRLKPVTQQRFIWDKVDCNDVQYHLSTLSFGSALGELRSVFGSMVGQIAVAYGLCVDDDLSRIIPD